MSALKKDHLTPPDDERCIWMTAGILSYHLCDRMFDCDNCPLDAAMHKHASQPIEARAARPEMRVAPAPDPLREGLRYGRNHFWTSQIDARTLRLGIEPGLSLALLDPKAVVLPSIGRHLQKGQTCIWIVMEGGTLPLDSPCSGIVRATNSLLSDQPHLLHLRSFDEGWLFELEPDEDSAKDEELLNADGAGPVYGGAEARFMKLLGNALQGNRHQVGLTLADGGQRLVNLADLLGPGKYFSILRKVYGA
jgi:glycine cleavage system H protein